MKKLLFIPMNFHLKPNPDFFNAFSKEFETLHHETISESIAFKPDYIYCQSGALMPTILAEIKTATNAKVIQWTGDCRDECMMNVTDYKGIADLTLLTVGIGQKAMYEKVLGHPVDYLQQGAFNSFFKPVKTEFTEKKIVFIGNNYSHFEGAVERTELCKILSKEFENFEVIGNGYNLPEFNNSRSIPYFESAEIYNNAYISISHACFNEIEGYYSNRTIDIMAAGSLCLMRHTPNIERWFKGGLDCMIYKSNAEAVEMINFLLNELETRNSIADWGQRTVEVFHTYDYRVVEIKNLLYLHNL